MTSKKPSKSSVKRHVRPDGGNAFLKDPEGGPALIRDDLAEKLAEEFLSSATSGEEQASTGHEVVVDEEVGGPFELSSGATEFAQGVDASNPADAEREAFPTVSARTASDTD